MMIIILDSR